MGLSLAHSAPSAHPDGDFAAHPDELRLRDLTRQQLEDRLAWLSWYNAAVYTAVMDYMEVVDTLAAAIDPTDPDPADDPDDAEEPAPFCLVCGSDIGIFLKFGLEWRHYTGTGLDDIQLTDPGHAPRVGWRASTRRAA